jgi:ferredoxin
MQMVDTAHRHRCTVVDRDGGESSPISWFEVVAGQRVLHEMIRRNIRAVPVGCRGGGCGVCRVRVLDGTYDSLRMSAKHISADDAAHRVVLACRIIPTTDLVIELAPCDSITDGATSTAAGAIAEPASGITDIPNPPEHISRHHKE